MQKKTSFGKILSLYTINTLCAAFENIHGQFSSNLKIKEKKRNFSEHQPDSAS